MAKKKLSKIGYVLPVEQISRKFAPRKHTAAAARNGGYGGPDYVIPARKWMGAATVNSYVNGYGDVQKNIFVVRVNGRTSLPTASELSNRSNFTLCRAWMEAAYRDLMAVNANQAKYIEAKEDFSKTIEGVSARGYQGMRGWMFAVAMAIKGGGGVLPTDHLLPAFDA